MARRKRIKDLDQRLFITASGSVAEVEGDQLIKQSIKTILSTIPGERVRQPEFGSQIYSLLFEPMDEITVTEIQDAIETAINNYENRVVLRFVQVRPNFRSNRYEITVQYFNNLTGRTEDFVASMRAIGED